nr:Ankyrin domain containing protein [Haemonchus contortus]
MIFFPSPAVSHFVPMVSERAPSATANVTITDCLSSKSPNVDNRISARLARLQCFSHMSTKELLKRDEHGETVLHRAVRDRDYDSIKLLLEKVPILRELASRRGETPAHLAVAFGDFQVVELLLSGRSKHVKKTALTRDCNGTSILTAAVTRGNNEIALWLLKHFGKDLTSLPNIYGITPLHVAASQGNLEYIRRATKCDPMSVDARDVFGCTPSAYAVQGGFLNVLEYLVETARAELGCISVKGQSLLHIASLCGDEKIVQWILNRSGTHMTLLTTVDNSNALHCAAYCGSVPVLRILLEPWSRKKRRIILALKDSRGNTPLHLATINEHTGAVLFLLNSDADVEAINACGFSPQAIALRKGNQDLATLIGEYTGKNKTLPSRPARSIDSQLLGTSVSSRCQSIPLSPMPRRASSPQPTPRCSSSEKTSTYTAIDGTKRISQAENCTENESSSLKEATDLAAGGSFTDLMKELDDETWTGMGLSAVEQIDKVLDEIELLGR